MEMEVDLVVETDVKAEFAQRLVVVCGICAVWAVAVVAY